MNLTRLLKMSPAEVGTRLQQSLSKRWSAPPACRLVASPALTPRLPDLAPLPVPSNPRRFDLLGYKDLDFGDPIDWHFDPVHHKRSPRLPWYQIPFLDFNQVGDHKVIWELNRHQHLVALAQTGYRDEVIAQWTHWQAENPYPIGINWASTLEVAFRALSWLWVRSVLGDFHPGLLPALHRHAWYIERFLSTYFSPNTHLLGEGVALFAIGVLCPEIAEASRWQAKGWRITLQQAEAQVRPDGFHFEQSVYYHVYARDFFQFARDLAATNGLPIPPSFEGTIEKMNTALSTLSQSGRLPNFGDDDGGRVILSPRPASTPSPAHAVGGIHIMSSRDSKLYIDAGPQGAFTAGHGHADALSIQLITNGRPILIDPGTYCYVCPDRDRFRGTAAHNTLQVDGRDQAQPQGPFAWTALPETTVDRWHSTETYDYFAGRHTGYAPVTHYRQVFGLKNRFWLVRDLVTGPLRHHLAIHWHYLDPHDLTILPPTGHAWTQSVEPFPWAPVYGQKDPAQVLRFATETTLPAEFAVLLIPSTPGVFRQSSAGVYHYKEPQGSHEFIFAGERFTYRATSAEGVTEFSL